MIVNDVSGGLADPDMGPTVADTGVKWVLNHSRGSSRDMYSAAVYTDVVSEVREELSMRVDDALDAGVDLSRLVLDPGLGFAKVGEQNWELLRNLNTFVGMGFPVLIGASRKGFLASVLMNGDRRPAADRDPATVAVTVAAARAGVWGVRVHEVAPSVEAIAVVSMLDRRSPQDRSSQSLAVRTLGER
ncbi:hypothetical protein GCM10007304_46070 [Rhodococcoides trifolii]|uniref:Pterin-binding domain-containing protein n=1 Tax=Rhodococcoides trifolii TaxID=908250 RepID=A0A917LI47_9NOCA|nr:hypothetical protein GCM10007304_46070 [Rhodococcus trifolii]